MAFTKWADVQRPLLYSEMDANWTEMESIHGAALEARDVAVSDTIIYPDTTAGLAATAEGGYFVVPDTATDELVYYRVESGVAVEKVRIGYRLPFAGGTLTGALNEAPPVTLASAATVNIGAAASNTVIVSGTAAITSLGTIAAGAIRYIRATGAFTLTHNATSLILYGSNIVATVGEVFRFESLGAGNWRLTGRHYAGPLARTDAINTWSGSQTFAAPIALTGAINNSISIGRADGTASTPFIDFNSGATAVDYDVRMIASGGTGTAGGGKLDVTGILDAVTLRRGGSNVLAQSDVFVSADQTITLAGALTLAHGFGAVPRAVKLALVCQTAELGYTIGDVLMDVSARTIASIVVDATNLNIRFLDSANVGIVNKTTGARTSFTVANWKARFFAIK